MNHIFYRKEIHLDLWEELDRDQGDRQVGRNFRNKDK